MAAQLEESQGNHREPIQDVRVEEVGAEYLVTEADAAEVLMAEADLREQESNSLRAQQIAESQAAILDEFFTATGGYAGVRESQVMWRCTHAV